MPKIKTAYQIFLGSPSDVQIDRESVDEVIQELNLTFGAQNDITLELKKWETHSAPGVDVDHQQELIKKDIGQYDLFIGLLGTRFGTKTNKSESGTEDEFNDAYDKFITDPSSVQLMVYFKKALVDPTKIDIEQLAKIQAFRTKIGSQQNVLYWEYEETAQLQKFLRLHISKRILDLQRSAAQKTPIDKLVPTVIAIDEYEELGVLDYQELIEVNLDLSTQAIERVSEATTWIGVEITKKAEEITALTAGGKQPSRKVLQSLLNGTASIMDNFSNRVEAELPIFSENFDIGIDAYSNLITISKSDLEVEEEEINEASDGLAALVAGMNTSIDGTGEFLDSVSALPRMSKELNKSKRRVVKVLTDLVHKLTVGRTVAIELQKNIEE